MQDINNRGICVQGKQGKCEHPVLSAQFYVNL